MLLIYRNTVIIIMSFINHWIQIHNLSIGNIIDIVNFIGIILDGSIARTHNMIDEINLIYTPYSLVIEEDGFIGLDITLILQDIIYKNHWKYSKIIMLGIE